MAEVVMVSRGSKLTLEDVRALGGTEVSGSLSME